MTATIFSDISSNVGPYGTEAATFCFKVVMADKVQTFCGRFKNKEMLRRMEVMEAESLLMGIHMAVGLGATKIEAFTDHLVVVTALTVCKANGWHTRYHEELGRLRREGIQISIGGCRGGVQELCHWEAFIRRRLWGKTANNKPLRGVPTHRPEILAIVNRVKAIKNPTTTRLS